MDSGVSEVNKPTTNYFRVGVRCAFFNDGDVKGIQNAWAQALVWLGTASDVRIRVWRMPAVQGPWSTDCRNGVIEPESHYMGRSQLGPVVS